MDSEGTGHPDQEAALTPSVRLASRSDLATATDVLVASFMDYPWTRYVIPAEGYADRLRELQRLYLVHAHHHGVVAVTDAADGVAALLPPDAPEPDQDVMNRIVALHGDRIGRLGSVAHAPQAWRLETIAVSPDRQGGGIGSALLAFALHEAAERGADEIVLETSDVRNVRLYQRHGFEVLDFSEASQAPPVWNMHLCPTRPLSAPS